MNKIVQIAAKTHNGITRDHNEDNFIVGTVPSAESWIVPDIDVNVLPEGMVFSVADGMGGENAGEIASEIAVTSIKTYFQQHFEIDKNNNLESSLVFAHNNIKDACRANPDYIGMGTTAVVGLLKNDKLSLSWVGDSRVYRYSIEGRITNHAHFVNGLELLTNDHSKVWEMVNQGLLDAEGARIHPESNIITQSLGDLYGSPRPDSKIYPIFKNDIILACSDGLNSMLSDADIAELIKKYSNELDVLADKLIENANLKGGKDNITVILVRIVDGEIYNQNLVNHYLLKSNSFNTIVTHRSNYALFYIGIFVLFIAGLIYLNSIYHYIPFMGKHVQTIPIDSFISIDSAKSEISNTPFSDSIVHNNENEVISKKPSEKIRTDKKSENIYSSSDINKFKYKLDSILSLIKIELDSVDNSKSTKVDLLIKRQKKIEQDGKSAKTIFSFEKLIKSAQELENELDKYPKVKK